MLGVCGDPQKVPLNADNPDNKIARSLVMRLQAEQELQSAALEKKTEELAQAKQQELLAAQAAHQNARVDELRAEIGGWKSSSGRGRREIGGNGEGGGENAV